MAVNPAIEFGDVGRAGGRIVLSAPQSDRLAAVLYANAGRSVDLRHVGAKIHVTVWRLGEPRVLLIAPDGSTAEGV